MAIAESRRLALFDSAKTSWGEDSAQTLMDLLPPDPDALATKADLHVGLAGLRADLTHQMSDQTRTLVLALVTIEVTIVLALLGAVLAS